MAALVLAALVACVWAAALLLASPIWLPIVVSVLLVGGFGLALLWQRMRARRRGAEVEAALRRQDQDKALSERSSVEPVAVLEMQGRVRELAAALRRSRFGRRWGDATLYALPWHLVMGPPGAGKSTLLQACGLALSTAGGRSSASRPGLATKGCEPLICNEGALIDTAGALALGEGGDAEWRALLEVLRRVRRKRPLDGIVLAYSVRDLVSDTPEQLEDKAKRLRSRLEDLGTRLGSVLPVYLLLTKADLLPGFSDFCADLPPDRTDLIWGATLEWGSGESDPASSVKAEFDLMKQALHADLIARMPGWARQPEGCAQALRFPVEFEAVRAPLVRLVDELFRPSSYAETPLLRGFYLASSGGPAGFDAGRAMALESPATQFAVHTNVLPSASGSYFAGKLFTDVILADRYLASPSQRRLRLERGQQVALGAAALALLLLGVLPPALSCVSNLSLIDASLEDARQASAAGGQPSLPDGAGGALDLLVQRYQQLQAEAQRFSVRAWWGPYTAAPLRDAIRLRYLEQLRAIVHGPLRARLSDALRVSSNLPALDPVEFETAYEQLQLYLMLAHPEKLEPEFAASALAKAWAPGPSRAALGTSPAAEAHVRNYVQRLQEDPSWAWAEDGVLVERARARLASMPIEELKYAALEKAAAGAPPVLPEHIFVGEAARYLTTRGKVEVPGLYTALGWQQVQPLLKPAQKDFAPWVIAQTTSGQGPAWGADQLTKLYFDRYIRAWMDFLVGLDVATPPDLGAAIDELAALGKAEGPYVRLFRKLAENVRLELKPPGLEEQALAKVAQVTSSLMPGGPAAPAPPAERRVSPVERYFRRMVRFGFGDAAPAAGMDLPPSLLTQYLEQLRSLEVSLRQLQEAAIDPTGEFGAELARTSASVERLLASFDQTERLALEPLLLNPIRGSQRIVEEKGKAALTDRWRVEVWEPYRRLVTHYPFVPSSGSDVALPDFGEFFRPQTGTFWRFYEETLASRFMRSGVRFVPRPMEAKAGFRSDFLECLSAAQQIGDAVFVDGASQPTVPFRVKMQSGDARVAETILIVDGERLVYRNEPEKWRALQWPGKDGPAGASLTVKGVDFDALVRREDGDFGFFRLLAAGDIKPVSPGSLVLEASWSWMLNGATSHVTIQFQASRQRHPFLPGLFSRFKCPAAITSSPSR